MRDDPEFPSPYSKIMHRIKRISEVLEPAAKAADPSPDETATDEASADARDGETGDYPPERDHTR